MSRTTTVVLLALALRAAPLAAQAPPAPAPSEQPPAPQLELEPVPHPDLAGLEPAVAASLRDARAVLEGLIAAPEGVLPAELAEAYGELGQLYHAHDLAAAAAASYRNAVLLAPNEPRWTYLLALLDQAAGRLEDAADRYTRAVELRPDLVAALVHLGEVRLAQDQPEEAERLFHRALSVARTAAAYAGLGQAALSRRSYREAIAHFEAALAAAPDANALHHPLALAYRGAGETERAREHLALAGSVGVRPPDPWLDELQQVARGERWHLLRGRVAFRKGRYADAATEFRAAVAARPESAGAHIALGAALAAAGDRQAALAEFTEALRLEPQNGTAHYNLGSLLMAEEGRAAEAAEHLRAAVAADPGDGAAHNALGRLLDRAGKPEEALVHFTEAVEHLPADEQAALDEAALLVRLERYRPARARLEEALKRLPDSGRLTHALARVLAGAPDLTVRDGARALELAQKVHAVRPEAFAAAAVALAMAELGRCDEAAQWQKRAVEAARAEGPPERLAELEHTLAGYERGAPCRPPGTGP
jgi:tetratricopeptide (TPR) repeat protein